MPDNSNAKQANNTVAKLGDVVLLLDEIITRKFFPISRPMNSYKGPHRILKTLHLKLPMKTKKTKATKKSTLQFSVCI